jgi:hypothetical protein
LTIDERQALGTYARSRKGRADLAVRARAMLLLADGASYTAITAACGWSSATIAKWKARFEADRLVGLWGRHKGSKPRIRTPQMEARILNWTRNRRPMAPRTRTLGKHPACPIRWSPGSGNALGCSRIGPSGTCARPTPRSKRKRGGDALRRAREERQRWRAEIVQNPEISFDGDQTSFIARL